MLGLVLILGGIKSKQLTKYKNTVNEAACTYAVDDNLTEALCSGFEKLCKVYFDKLIDREYLDADIINPITKEKVKNNTSDYVQITWENDRMMCNYKEG